MWAAQGGYNIFVLGQYDKWTNWLMLAPLAGAGLGLLARNAGSFARVGKSLLQPRRLLPTTNSYVKTLKNHKNLKNLKNLTRKEVGEIGEMVAKRFLGDNGFTDIVSVQNRSGNGIDVIAKAKDGRLVFFEVKASAIGKIGGLSVRQRNMTGFVGGILEEAAEGAGRYKNLDIATRNTAGRLFQEFRRNPLNISGYVIGIDLRNLIIRISPWT